jgi:hypothetical protein
VPAREGGLATHVDDVIDRLPEDERVVLSRGREQGFAVVELTAGHDAMITHPRELAALLSPSMS